MRARDVRPGARVVVEGRVGYVLARAPRERDRFTGQLRGSSVWWVQFASAGKGWAERVEAGHMAPVRQEA